MAVLNDDDMKRARVLHLFQTATDRQDELDRQQAKYRVAARNVPDSVGHSLDMLWLYFTHTVQGDPARGGREHVLTLAEHIRHLREQLRGRQGTPSSPPQDP